MRTRKTKSVFIANLNIGILFILPVLWLDLYKENYSTLSLHTKGYFYLLSLGILCGLILGYETYYTCRKYYRYMFIAMFLGTIIPHHVPYNLQGNLHLLFAYSGFVAVMAVSMYNLFLHNEKKMLQILCLLMCIPVYEYMNHMMFNTVSEIVIMTSVMFINYYLFCKYS